MALETGQNTITVIEGDQRRRIYRPYTIVPAKKKRHNVVVAKPVPLASCLRTPVRAKRACSGLPIMESKTFRGSRQSLQVARGIIEVTPRPTILRATDKLVKKKTGVHTNTYDHSTNSKETSTFDPNWGYPLKARTGHGSCGTFQNISGLKHVDVTQGSRETR